ncbi:bacterioferritin [Prevotella sp. KH2C16]|uniref:ferritin-like domain-containing protein n=1 Tax=Prevotella sp. KH2C16 TaxID=1855325 RepID=UPI0008EDD971|nr:ferritin-like domain-containing protein [Prevotella sp. KH2C16]SFG18011.1 bacterioferritin [Prevotella sp. KH2C16]
MNAKNSIEALQFFTTGLTNGAFAHLVQGKHFEAMGFKKLGEKYTGHYDEEMGWVKKFIERINDLGGEVKIEDQKGRELVKDPVDYIKADLAIQEKGVELLYGCMEGLKDDPTTYDIMKGYLADEEEDLYWSQEQVAMVDLIGRENWLLRQL